MMVTWLVSLPKPEPALDTSLATSRSTPLRTAFSRTRSEMKGHKAGTETETAFTPAADGPTVALAFKRQFEAQGGSKLTVAVSQHQEFPGGGIVGEVPLSAQDSLLQKPRVAAVHQHLAQQPRLGDS